MINPEVIKAQGDCERCDKSKDVPLTNLAFGMSMGSHHFTVDFLICEECCMDSILQGFSEGNARSDIEDAIIAKMEAKYEKPRKDPT